MKRRILSLLLVLCMLLSTAVLFASCGKKTVELAGYNVVCGKDASDGMLNEIATFAESLKAKTGEKVSVKKVNADDALDNEDKLEILIGNTNRPETAKALKKIKGHGYTVKVVGKKIVIVGTTNLLTSMALDHFKSTCLSGDATAITVEKTVVSDVPMTEITVDTAFVYSATLLDSADFLREQLNALQIYLSKISNLKSATMLTKTDAESAESEILLGMVKRDECQAFVSGMNAYDYGVGAINGTLIIAGLGDAMTAKAVELAKSVLEDSVCEIEDKKRIFIPSEFSRIFTDAEGVFFDDFPKPELPITGTVDVGDNSLEHCYQGEGVNADAYYAYCKTLEAAGYTVYGEPRTVENSIFRTYVNTEKNATLYVCYSAFKHAAAQKIANLENLDFQPAIRVVSAPLDAVNLLDSEILTQDLSYDRVTNSSITGVKMDSEMSTSSEVIHGNNYIFMLEDGSFIVFDGGQSYKQNVKRFYEVLLALYKKSHNNAAPTVEDPIRISAWILSHGHTDHFATMKEFITTYCTKYQTYKITLDRLITNLTSKEECYVVGNSNNAVAKLYAELSSKVKDAEGEEQGFKYYKVHTGQKFYIANTEFEVMYTHEDMYPNHFYRFNETSTVFRMTTFNTTNHQIDQASRTTVMWLGDAEDTPSACMRGMYGDYLKSDMVQVAHHDYQGSEWELYQLISPKCVWWPVIKERYNTYCHTKESTLYFRVTNYKINYELASVQHIFLLDDHNYTLTITESGPDYKLYEDSATGICDISDNGSGVISTVPFENGVSNNVRHSYIRTKNYTGN